jgi:hypothetical protein
VLEVSAKDSSGKEIFREQREYKNIGLSRKGEPATAAWLISSYSYEKSTALRAGETRRETFTITLPEKYTGKVAVQARLLSHHGLPVNFGEPEKGTVVLEKSKTVAPPPSLRLP